MTSSAVERFLAAHRAAAETDDDHGVRDRRRLVAVAAAYAPMLAVGLLPLTFVVAFVGDVVASLTLRVVGLALIVVAVLAAAAVTAHRALEIRRRADRRGWRRWVPYILTAAIVGTAATEVVSGSRAPDPVLLLWFLCFIWLIAFLPYTQERWSVPMRALWIVGPTATLVVIVVTWTAGFFGFRFERSIEELDRYATSVTGASRFEAGVNVGSFEVKARGRYPGCSITLHIDGWYERDERWIARCAEPPRGDPVHLGGDWYQLDG